MHNFETKVVSEANSHHGQFFFAESEVLLPQYLLFLQVATITFEYINI